MSETDANGPRTTIFRFRSGGEDPVGYVADATIFRLRWDVGQPIGRAEATADGWRIFRNTRHDEKELGTVSADGSVRSHGLFEGGELGWLETDGTVVQGGLIFAEEEVGRVDGPDEQAAAGALLLIFVPEEDEASREMQRRG